MPSEGKREPIEERAFALALFVLGDPQAALGATVEAFAKLEVAATAQERRRSYLPRFRRRRVSTGREHLLQRLLLIETEPFERRAEAAGDPAEVDLIVSYVKHLVRIAWKRSSFYAVVGLSRLLYRYATAETMDLYSLVVQDPGRVRDDDAFRAGKKRLMEEIADRFGDRLEVVAGGRGERRIATVEDAAPFAGRVAECLRRFTPWDTGCPVPAAFDPISEELPALGFAGGDPDREHAVEVRRFHATLHPDCYGRLVAALGLPAPERRLGVPLFRGAAGGGGRKPLRRPGDRAPGREAQREVRRAIDARLAAEELRRKSRGRFLSVRLDGEERARLDRNGGRVTIDGEEGAERVEIYGEGGERLALCLLSSAEGLGRRVARTSAGWATFAGAGSRGNGAFRIEVLWEPNAGAFAALADRLRGVLALPWTARAAYAAVLGLGLGLAVGLWRAEHPPFEVRTLTPVPAPRPSPPSPPAERAVPSAPTPSPRQGKPAGRPPEGEVRGAPSGAPAVPVSEVTSVLVDPLGEGAFAGEVREALVEELRRGGFAVVERSEEAEARLGGSLEAELLSLDLIDAEGRRLWRLRLEAEGDPRALAARAVTALRGAAGRPPLPPVPLQDHVRPIER